MGLFNLERKNITLKGASMEIEDLVLDLHSPILGTKAIIEHIHDLLNENMDMSRDELKKIHALTIMANLGIEHVENIRQEYRLAYIKEFKGENIG